MNAPRLRPWTIALLIAVSHSLLAANSALPRSTPEAQGVSSADIRACIEAADQQVNTPGSYMLSAIVQKVTGQTVLDYLRPRLFEPLGIENPEWGSSPQGVTFGGWGLKIRTEDIAKFGQLYLQQGKWHGKQLVPAAWVEQATAKQVSNGSDPTKDWDQGYGFQFWRCRHHAYRGDGANGQFCIVLPEQDAVIAITADTRDMQAELNVVWDKLLPALHAKRLPANKPKQARLQQTLANLRVRPPTVPAP